MILPAQLRAPRFADIPPAPAGPAGPPPRPPPSLPPRPLERGAASPQAARLLAATGAAGAAGAAGKRLERGVDSYFRAAASRYVIDGKPVDVVPQFRMVGGRNDDRVLAGQRAIQKRIGNGQGQFPLEMIGRVFAGRGSAAEVGRITQGLLDAGKLPAPKYPGEPAATRVQRMMWEHGVGMDCAGFVQQGLASVHGKTARQLGLQDVHHEDLSAIDRNPHFEKVDIHAARPGDLITLRDTSPSQPGHTVMVARHSFTDGASISKLFPPGDVARSAFISSKAIEVFEVDSSWGTDPKGEHGGVQRRTWIYNRETSKWAHLHPTVGMVVDDVPYIGHTIDGTFRVKAAP
jgi:hypothetical protein